MRKAIRKVSRFQSDISRLHVRLANRAKAVTLECVAVAECTWEKADRMQNLLSAVVKATKVSIVQLEGLHNALLATGRAAQTQCRCTWVCLPT